MYTRWRLYILAIFVALIAACLILAHVLRRRGIAFSRFQTFLLVAGAVLTVETLIVSTLSNYNLGVILPAFFGIPLIALAFLLPHMGSGFLRFLKWFTLGCYCTAGALLLFCGCLMLSAQRRPDGVKADAVIVLGAAVHGDKVTWVLENRLNTAIDYLSAHPDAITVVSGGQGSGETVSEGSAMKKYMLAHGIAEDRVIAEEKARNTVENFRYSMELIEAALGPDVEIAFVTTDFHVFRAGRVAAAQGVDAAGIPAPDVWYLRLNNFLRESVGICVYFLRGQL